MSATRVSWRFAEITNSFDIDCLPGARRDTVRMAGALRVSRHSPRAGNDVKLVTSSRWPEVELHVPRTPFRPGTAPHRLGALSRYPPEALSTGSRIIFFKLHSNRLNLTNRSINKSSEADVIHQPQSQEIRPDAR